MYPCPALFPIVWFLFCFLQELELRFLYLSSPLLGTWLEDLGGVTELRGLRLLRLAGEQGL